MTATSYFIRAASGRRWEWKPNPLAGLSRAPEHWARYEPWQLEADAAVPVPLTTRCDARGFEWSVTGTYGLTACCVRGRQILRTVKLPLSGRSEWGAWAGATAIDLVPVDEDSRVAGEAVRIAVPPAFSTRQVEFLPTCKEGEIWVTPASPLLGAARVVAWHRIGAGTWNPAYDYGEIGQGLLVAVPEFQGGFAAVADGRVLGLQIFGFGRIHSDAPEDLAELVARYPAGAVETGPWDEWPAWVQTGLIAEIAGTANTAVPPADPAQQDSWLRAALRRELLADYFPPDFQAWRPDLAIADFVVGRWPALGGILECARDARTLRLAMSLRNSAGQIEEALRWAGDTDAELWRCLRLAPIRIGWRSLRDLIPASAMARGPLDALGGALDEAEEDEVCKLWQDVKQAVFDEFHRPAELLEGKDVAGFHFLERIRELADGLGLTVNGGPAAIALKSAAAALAQMGAGRFADLMEAARVPGLIGEARWREWTTRRAEFVSLMKRATEPPPGFSYEREIGELRSTARNPEVGAALACRAMERELRSEIAAALASQVKAAGLWSEAWPIPGAPELGEFLEACARMSRAIDDARQEKARRLRLRRELALHLPAGAEPEPASIAAHLNERREAWTARVAALAAFGADLDPADARALRELNTGPDEADVPAPAGGDLAGALEQLLRWEAVETSLDGVAARLLARLNQPPLPGLPAEALAQWFATGRYGLARAAVELVRRAADRIELQAEIGEVLWLSADQAWAGRLMDVRARFARLAEVSQIADVERLDRDLEACRRDVRAQHGLAEIHKSLRCELERRWAEFRDRSFPSDAEFRNPQVLGGLLRRLGRNAWSPGSLIVQAPARLPHGVSESEIRTLLERYELWPSVARQEMR